MTYRTSPLAQMLPLESRRLFAAVFPTDHEQYLVELINRGRANPAAEAARYATDLNEGLPAGTVSATPKQPLAINPYVTDAARKHSQYMIDTDTFSHTGSGSSTPKGRMTSAGYYFDDSSWASGENIAWRGTTATPDVYEMVADIHRDLYVDEGIEGRGHRVNLMNNSFREIGAGIVIGAFTTDQTFNAVMATEDFASSGTGVFLTGVAYSDGVVADNFYTPGEGLGGVVVTATRAGDGATFQATAWSSGGYSLPLTAGTYTVTATGGGLGGIITYNNVVVGTENVKRDFTPASIDSGFATIIDGKLEIQGTTGADAITVTKAGSNYSITRGDQTMNLDGSAVTHIEIYGHDGNDHITVGAGVMGTYVDAGPGNDYVQGGDGDDTLTGGGGKDQVFGGIGDDRVAGNGGHDRLAGEAGKDRLYGGEGDDVMEGGSSGDRFWPEGGNNICYGQNGDDYFYARQQAFDQLFGQDGIDHALIDAGFDMHEGVEDLLA